MPADLVPVTPSVVSWAIRESGYSIPALAILLKVPAQVIEGWTKGTRPELPVLQAFANAVERPMAAFLLPSPPASAEPTVKFRHSRSLARRVLNPEERRRIREGGRLQEIISWMAREMDALPPRVPSFTTKDEPERVAVAVRDATRVSVETQLAWPSPAAALQGWREAIEACGVSVMMFPMGEESCRGFSVWDDRAPLIAVNTSWLAEARVFTLFHEFAHLVTRTNSACAEDATPGSSTAGDAVERWCERMAAAVVIPTESLNDMVAELAAGSTRWRADLSAAGRVAQRFRVSRRAAALRLIEGGHAEWALFKSIPAHTDRRTSGGGGAGRTREELRRQWYGDRTMRVFSEALRRNVVGAADVVDYLGVSADALNSGGSRRYAEEID